MHEKESGFSSPKFSRLRRSKPCIITVTSLNVRCPRVSSRQFGQLTLLCHLSEQVDVMVMVFILDKVRDMVMVTDMVVVMHVVIVIGKVLVTVVEKLLIDS